MRDIKFRAWDKTSNVMRNDISSIDYSSDGNIAQINVVTGSDILFPDKEADLMQYTGFNDENLKEIYEGDILMFTMKSETKDGYTEVNDTYYYPQIVKWDDEKAGFVMENFRYFGGYGFEVIGNVYEHPELLEQYK